MQPKYIKARRCSKCRLLKPLSEFSTYSNSSHLGGKQTRRDCKDCERAANRVSTAKWSSENSEKRKAYREKNAEKLKAASKRFYQNNKEKKRQQQRQWRKDNPEKYQAQQARRRARARKAKGEFNGEVIEEMYRDQSGLCAYCEQDLDGVFHIEHMVPLCRGGVSDWSNIALTCPLCNHSKGTKTVEELFN